MSPSKKSNQSMLWGVATSAYQIEGAAFSDGKGPSIWDAYCMVPGKVRNGDKGDVACDHYNRFSEDISIMKELGVGAYRFSLSWPRILPAGKGAANPAGINFYHRLIDGLLEAGIEPLVTLYHWDLPLALQLELNGWADPKIPDAFAQYAELCFKEFGPKVKRWLTINEPWVVAMHGHGIGMDAPGRTSMSEPYLVAHHLILAHAKAVEVYRSKYQSKQGGQIGITLNCDWRDPYTQSEKDIQAANRAIEFSLGWYADPVFFGDYPEEMKRRIGARLPKFTSTEQKLIKGSSDFFGLNHYSTLLTEDADIPNPTVPFDDCGVKLHFDPSWEKTTMGWAVVPQGFGKLLKYISQRYSGCDIYVTENGCAAPYTDDATAIEDTFRAKFLESYIGEALKQKADGVPLKGYFVWSLMDNFEWVSGFSQRFGIVHVDYQTLKRTPKKSFDWYRKFIHSQR